MMLQLVVKPTLLGTGVWSLMFDIVNSFIGMVFYYLHTLRMSHGDFSGFVSDNRECVLREPIFTHLYCSGQACSLYCIVSSQRQPQLSEEGSVGK
jgi:hypothetical protein